MRISDAELNSKIWSALHPDKPTIVGWHGEGIMAHYHDWPVWYREEVRPNGTKNSWCTSIPRYHDDDAASAQLRREMKAEGWEWKVTTTQGGYFAAFWKGDTICHAVDADDRLAVLRAAHEALCPA